MEDVLLIEEENHAWGWCIWKQAHNTEENSQNSQDVSCATGVDGNQSRLEQGQKLQKGCLQDEVQKAFNVTEHTKMLL